MNTEYDFIIIGSGLGGLVCGYILAKNGYKIAIVEKNSQIGGCLQTFKRKGIKFDTGMHYIGSMQPGQVLHALFNYLNLLSDVKLSPLDPDGFDTISFRGDIYKFANGYTHFTDTLSEKFPHNRKDIEAYIHHIKKISASSPLYNGDEAENNNFMETEYIKTSINDYIASITQNPLLQNVLAGNMPLYAGVKDKTPMYIHALVTNFYIQSAYRIVGGSDTIASSLANSITSLGGQIFTQHHVEQILCDDKKATTIVLKNGNIMRGKAFISDIHPEATMNILNTPLIRRIYKERIRNLQNTISNFTVYIKFKPNTVPYLNTNFYYYDHDNVWQANAYNKDKWPESYLFMHQCHQENPTYAESAELIGYMHFDEVKKWENTTIQQRGEAYLEFKKEKSQLLLKKLEESFPGINQQIEFYESSSPLTYRDYTGTKEGSMYGIIRDKNFPVQTLVSQRTKIPNLLLTGQNINSHGILGVIVGALITCSEFLGISKLINDIKECNNVL